MRRSIALVWTFDLSRSAFKASLLLGSVVLAGCGGGTGAEAQKAPALAESAPNARALGTTSGWVGRAPRYEVINGITVPPEPAPSVNNATIAGVDINANGLRDDVERTVARNFGLNAAQFNAATTFAKAEQRFIVSADVAARDAYVVTTVCSSLPAAALDPLTRQLLNTPDRMGQYRGKLAGVLITGKECQ